MSDISENSSVENLDQVNENQFLSAVTGLTQRAIMTISLAGVDYITEEVKAVSEFLRRKVSLSWEALMGAIFLCLEVFRCGITEIINLCIFGTASTQEMILQIIDLLKWIFQGCFQIIKETFWTSNDDSAENEAIVEDLIYEEQLEDNSEDEETKEPIVLLEDIRKLLEKEEKSNDSAKDIHESVDTDQ